MVAPMLHTLYGVRYKSKLVLRYVPPTPEPPRPTTSCRSAGLRSNALFVGMQHHPVVKARAQMRVNAENHY